MLVRVGMASGQTQNFSRKGLAIEILRGRRERVRVADSGMRVAFDFLRRILL